MKYYLPNFFCSFGGFLPEKAFTNFTKEIKNQEIAFSCPATVPGGLYGRILLGYLTSLAFLMDENKSVKMQKTELLNALELDSSVSDSVCEQLRSFNKSSFRIDGKMNEPRKILATTGNIMIIQDLSIENENIEFKFSDNFIRFTKVHTIELEYEKYRNFSSCKEMDIYSWLVYRFVSLQKIKSVSVDSEMIEKLFSGRSAENIEYMKTIGKMIEPSFEIEQVEDKYILSLE